ncbi:unnamed protein product [Merluccius merluccius]
MVVVVVKGCVLVVEVEETVIVVVVVVVVTVVLMEVVEVVVGMAVVSWLGLDQLRTTVVGACGETQGTTGDSCRLTRGRGGKKAVEALSALQATWLPGASQSRPFQ